MAKVYERIDDEMAAWIRRQRMFFIATAPLLENGHVNCSPKGGDSFRIIDPSTVAYQDLTGSGAETLAHLRENGRIVIMFCAFEGAPAIVRLHGAGEALFSGHPDFAALAARFLEHPGTRALIRVRIACVSESCGFGVPLFDYLGERDELDDWSRTRGAAGLREYRRKKNARSIDGLPSVEED